MYYIKKYFEGFGLHNDDTGQSRLLSKKEEKKLLEEYPVLADRKVSTLFIDNLLFKEKKAI